MNLSMQLFGRQVEVKTKSLQLSPLSSRGSGWWPIIRESFTGAWQTNVEIQAGDVLTYSAVYACVNLIASSIAKLGLRLVEQDANGIWTEAVAPSAAAFAPVLRKPNRYQTRIKFVEQWQVSKYTHGNAYILKQRDNRGGTGRGVVTAMYVLDPTRVTPLVAQDGSVYYQLKRDDLSGQARDSITVPASEIIHDTCIALYHPLIGVSPIYACGLAALQGISIQNNSNKFFTNGSQPGGILTAPGAISDETAARLKATWDANYTGDNVGKVAVVGDGLKYESMSINAVDAQLIEQLNWTAANVCSAFLVQPYMISVGPPPPYANVEPLMIQFYSQCLQSPIEQMEILLDEGLELPKPYGTEFDLDDLMRMDTASKTTAAQTSINAGMKPNEARKKYYGLGPVPGGNAVYLQQQYFSLEALAERDADQPFSKPTPVSVTPPAEDEDEEMPEDMAASFGAALKRKALEAHLAAA